MPRFTQLYMFVGINISELTYTTLRWGVVLFDELLYATFTGYT